MEEEQDMTPTLPPQSKSNIQQNKQRKYDWTAHYDDEGRLYYYNDQTQESAWEAPSDGFNPPETENEHPTVETEEDEENNIPWVAFTDEEGREYYYNEETGETQWDKPTKYRHAPDDLKTSVGDTSTAMDVTEREEDAQDDSASQLIDDAPEITTTVEDMEEDKAEPVDPAALRLQEAEDALNSPDSILEKNCMSHVGVVVAATESNNPAKAISALIENYHGQTAVCGLLARWLTDLHQAKEKADTKDSAIKMLPDLNHGNCACAEKIREAAQDVINKIVKERFTKDAGDSILDLSKAEAAFLEDMMDSPRWRKLLIDLSSRHKDSAVLLYCLRAISKRGHHREISKRINQSDHFAVFNAMLLSELAVVGCQAVSAGSDALAAMAMDELVRDLNRSCSSTSYTYLYAVELLRRLVNSAKTQASKSSGNDAERLRRAVRKWEAMIQGLESHMVDPTATAAGSSPIFRKRRLDIALTISELNQKKERRLIDDSMNAGNDKGHRERLEAALLTLLRRHSVGIQLDDAVLDQLLPSGLDLDTKGVGDLLLQQPLAVCALLGHVYKPGPGRVTSPSIRNKCARLVALSTIAAQQVAKKEIEQMDPVLDDDSSERVEVDSLDEIALTRIILQGGQLCEQLETMISFLVTSDGTTTEQGSSNPGQKLCGLALSSATVGLGVMMWAEEFTHGPDFASSASFATLSPSILSLVRLVSMKHAFARSYALKVAMTFLHHSNPDISYQKVNAIKECSLRLLLFLTSKGDVIQVFSSVASRLEQAGSSDLDASLVRYFIAGVLEMVKAPVSPVFVYAFGNFLKAPKVVDAVRSAYFAKVNNERLQNLLKSFKDIRQCNQLRTGEEGSLITSLFTMYDVQ
jgi:hypothetical protein